MFVCDGWSFRDSVLTGQRIEKGELGTAYGVLCTLSLHQATPVSVLIPRLSKDPRNPSENLNRRPIAEKEARRSRAPFVYICTFVPEGVPQYQRGKRYLYGVRTTEYLTRNVLVGYPFYAGPRRSEPKMYNRQLIQPLHFFLEAGQSSLLLGYQLRWTVILKS